MNRTPSNVPGPFYVAKDECITCGAPEAEAPSLIRHDGEHCSCYFYRQPENAEDKYLALRALAVCCVGAVRYGGADPDVLRRAGEIGVGNQCDQPVPSTATIPRTYVTFHLAQPGADAKRVAEQIAAVRPTTWSRTAGPVRRTLLGGGARFRWGADIVIRIRRLSDGKDRWLGVIKHRNQVNHWTGSMLDDALRLVPGIDDRRWYTAREFKTHGRWSPFPF